MIRSYVSVVSIVVEFATPADTFLFAGALPDVDVFVEMERVVPIGSEFVPYLWVAGPGTDRFVDAVAAVDVVRSFDLVKSVGGESLYRLDLRSPDRTLVALREAGGILLQARWQDGWLLRSRFDDRADASTFMRWAADEGVEVGVERVLTAAGRVEGPTVELTAKQRAALEAALEAGYFDSPKRATLEGIAADMDISPQALSKRVRRATELVLRATLEHPRRPFVRGPDDAGTEEGDGNDG
jgi:predicted DNA binding protein